MVSAITRPSCSCGSSKRYPVFPAAGRHGGVRRLVDAEIAELSASERPMGQHALHGLLNDALGELALEDRAGGALLDAADETGVVHVDLLLALAPGQNDLLG